MASTLYLIGSVFILLVAGSAWFRVRRAGPLVPLYFMSAWLAGELALQVIAIGALVTVVFAAFGAFSDPPGVLGLTLSFAAWGLLGACYLRSLGTRGEVERFARDSGLPIELDVSHTHGLLRPFRMRELGVQRLRDIPYGEVLPGDKGGRNLLDVVMPEGPGEKRPILVQIHGGGWVIGDKREQGGPLMARLASRGWVCFAINYRLAPKAPFPAHIVDVKRALHWIREHAGDYGGDPDFLCVSGGSAGGHLSALTALSQNDPTYQPGFETADTRVSAAVPFYGIYDFQDSANIRREHAMSKMLERMVFQCSPEQEPELWHGASPINRVSANAPPFLIIQGSHDILVFAEEGRDFATALREKSRNPVHYLELEGGQHAFEIFHSVRSQYAVRAAVAFLEAEHEKYRERVGG